MPARPHDSMEFLDAMGRVAQDLRAQGDEDLAARVLTLATDMRVSGHGGDRAAQNTRSHVTTALDEIAQDPRAARVRGDLVYASGWIQKAESIGREVDAKHHINRRPSRDIRRR